MKHLKRHARIQPAALQIEINWSWPQHELVQVRDPRQLVVGYASVLRANLLSSGVKRTE